MRESDNQEPAEEATSSSRNRWMGCGCLSALAFFLFIFFVSMTGGVGLIEAIFNLIFGWWGFLERTVPKITWNWDIVGMGLLCVTLILFLAHYFFRWLSQNVSVTRGTSWQWPWKWTWCGLSAVMIFFLVGMAIGGMAHQIGWILTSPQPWFEVKERGSEMREIEMGYEMACDGAKGDSAILRSNMWNFQSGYLTAYNQGIPWLETYQVFFIEGENNKVRGMIIFPRDPKMRADQGAILSLDTHFEHIVPQEISEFIQTNQEHIVPF